MVAGRCLWVPPVASILASALFFLSGCDGDGGMPPTIANHPADQAVTVGGTATFTVRAEGYPQLIYQWYRDGVPIPGATSPTYTTPAATSADDGAVFTCIVSNTAGSVGSNAAAIVMTAPLVTVHPTGQTATEGETATFDITATGPGTLAYQWKKDGVAIAGATGGTYTTPVTVLADDGAQFTCAVSNVKGAVTSNPATLVVNMAPPAITAHPSDQLVTEGQTATFAVSATSSAPMTYQWRKDGVDIAGAASAGYTTPATTLADDTVRFDCVVTNAGGSTTSAAATLRVHGPPGSLAWVKQVEGSGDAQAMAVGALSDDSVVVAGYFDGSIVFGPGEPGQTTLFSAGGSFDIFIACYSCSGTFTWVKRAGGVGDDYALDVAVLSDCSVVVTGLVRGTATFGQGEPGQAVLTSAGDDDVFIARYNPDGTLAWAKRAGGMGPDSARGVAALSDDGVAVAGKFEDTATFGPGETNQANLTVAAYGDIFIARYNPDGTLAWARQSECTRSSAAFGVAALSDDSVVVTGTFRDFGTFGQGELNETTLYSGWDARNDIFIAQYDPDGTLAWAKSAGGRTGGDLGYRVVALSDDSAVITGEFAGGAITPTATFGEGEPNETTLNSAGAQDIFVARYDPDGTLAWAKRAGGAFVSGAPQDAGHGVAAFSDDSTVVTGYYSGTAAFGPGEPNQTNLTSARNNIFIARYNPDGTLAWAKRVVGTGASVDEGRGVAVLSDDSAVVTGWFTNTPVVFGSGEANETSLSAQGKDAFIARYYP